MLDAKCRIDWNQICQCRNSRSRHPPNLRSNQGPHRLEHRSRSRHPPNLRSNQGTHRLEHRSRRTDRQQGLFRAEPISRPQTCMGGDRERGGGPRQALACGYPSRGVAPAAHIHMHTHTHTRSHTHTRTHAHARTRTHTHALFARNENVTVETCMQNLARSPNCETIVSQLGGRISDFSRETKM